MATYYIDPTGSDTTGNGSISTPWKTLLKASQSVTTTGNTIHINAGTYLENTRIALSPGVSLEGEGDTSIITNTSLTSLINYGPNGSNGDAIINLTSSSVVNGNQTISYLKFDGSNLTCSHAFYVMNRHNVVFHHCTFIKFNYSAVVWWASGTGEDQAPATRLTGSMFYDNIVTDCAGYNQQDDSFYGALYCGGHSGMRIYNNTMAMNGHSTGRQGWPIKFWLWGGMMLDCKIYNNRLEKTDFSVWDFVIESTGEDGMEIYNNIMVGGIDLNKQYYGGAYTWSVYIHDNIIGPSSPVSALSVAGITLEHQNTNVLIERNFIQNCSPGILFTPRSTAQNNIIIRYNVFHNITTSSYYNEGITMNPGGALPVNGFYFYNNVLYGHSSYSPEAGIKFVHAGGANFSSAQNVKIINNVIANFNGYNGAPITLTGASVFNGLWVQNNIFYNNGNSNQPRFTGTPSNYTNSDNLITNPLFVSQSTGNYELQAGSPGINAGQDLGLTTDYRGYVVPIGIAPDIGAYEYGSYSDASTFVPTVTTTAISDISTYSATSGGNVTYDGSVALVYRGICWSTSVNPTTADSSTRDSSIGEGSYVSYLTSLNASTHYFVRAFAYNSVGTSYGVDVSFNTLATPDASILTARHHTYSYRIGKQTLKLNRKLIILK